MLKPIHRRALLVASLLFASGCAMFGEEPAPTFVTVAVVTRGDANVDLEADSTGKSAMVGGGAGAVSAGAVGAGAGAALGLAMGPFAPAAVPFFAVVFGVGGAAAGATTGLVVGGLQGLPKEKAEQITQALVLVGQGRDFQGELRFAVDGALPESRRGMSGSADATAILQLTEIELEQHLSDVLSVHMEATMTLEWGGGSQPKSWNYVYDTPEQHVDEWLVEDGAPFDIALTAGIEHFAAKMSSDITSPAMK